MAAITIQQVEQNLAAMPEEQRAVAEEAMGMLSDDQLQSVLDVFDIQISVEEAPQPEEVPIEEPMADDELPTLPMPEEEALPAPPMEQEMQELKLGGQAQVAGMIDDQAVPNTEANTVSDKSETSLPEGAFVISASAVEEAGEIDLVERIIKPAIAALAKEGVSIKLEDITQPAKQLDGGVDVALSEGEIIIPPPLARKIGLGLLRKINDRGKKETEEKIEETQVAEQAPQEQAPQEQVRVRANAGGKIDKQTDMLARILISEAGGEGAEGMQVVANVVANRIADRKTNFKTQKTFEDVIAARLPSGNGNEFTGFDNDLYKKAHDSPEWENAVDLAQQQISGKLEDITGGATFYRNKNSKAGSTARGQGFFDSRVKSGRFIEGATVGGHTIYLDTHATPFDKSAGRTSEPLTTEVTGTPVTFQESQRISASEFPTPENVRRRNQGADTMTIYTDPEQPPAN